MPHLPDLAASNRARVARRRTALRVAGLRPRQIWLPDLRGAAATELALQVARIAERTDRSDDLQFAEHAQYWPGDPA